MAPCKIVLLACGSFNPPTNMHFRMFELARDHVNRLGQYTVVGGVMSPVHDGYGKKDLASASHRVEMLKRALDSSNWIKLSEWECNQEAWSRSLQVIQYHQNTLNSFICDNNNRIGRDPIQNHPNWISDDVKNSSDPVTVKVLCGADLLESFNVPGLWKDSDIETILSQHGLVVITREGSNPLKFVYESDLLTRHLRNILVVPEWIGNEVSSTKVRRALRRQESVRYLIPDAVVDYIAAQGLYGFEKTTTSKYDNLSIPLNTFILTPSPSDVNMLSVSPSLADQDITLSLQPLQSIDTPDAPKPKKKVRIFKNETEVTQFPGHAVQVVPIDELPTKQKKVNFVENCDSPQKVTASMKEGAEVQKVVLEGLTSPKKVKKPPRLSDPTRSRNMFKRSNSDVPMSRSVDDFEDAVSVKIEFTKDGVKVISDKESIV